MKIDQKVEELKLVEESELTIGSNFHAFNFKATVSDENDSEDTADQH